MDHHSELVLICAECAELARDPGGCLVLLGGHLSPVQSWAIYFFARGLQRSECPSWFPLILLFLCQVPARPGPGLVGAFILSAIMAVVTLLNLGRRVPWLASKKGNYILSSPHTPVAFNWMQSLLSSFHRQTLECGLGWFKWPPYPGSEMNEPSNEVMLGHSGCCTRTFASKKIPEALVSITYQKGGCPIITMVLVLPLPLMCQVTVDQSFLISSFEFPCRPGSSSSSDVSTHRAIMVGHFCHAHIHRKGPGLSQGM